MRFSRISILSVVGFLATVQAFGLQHTIKADNILGSSDDDIPVTTDDFRILTNDNTMGYQIRIKTPRSCEQGIQYSGYIDNLEQDDHLFFWFIESRSSPKDDPTVLWLNGGPGCSSLVGAFFELGPCLINADGNDTIVNPHSWNSEANVVFLDQPVNVGYSYGKSKMKSTVDAARDVYAFLQIFLGEFVQYAKNPLHLTGESYGGHYLPVLANEIVTNNKFAEQHGRVQLHLDSMAIGNGFIDGQTQYKYYQDFGCAKNESKYQPFFDDKTCDEMETTYPQCYALADTCYKHPSSLTCVKAIEYCDTHQGFPQYNKTGLNPYDIRHKCEGDSGFCYHRMTAINKYTNLGNVRTTFGVDPLAGNYSVCNDVINHQFITTGDTIKTFVPQVATVLSENVRVLIYAGDMDFMCNWMGVKAWTLLMNWSGKEAFNGAMDEPWINHATGEKAGEVRTYDNFTFLRVYNAGHMVPYDQPANSLDFISRWLKNEPLHQ